MSRITTMSSITTVSSIITMSSITTMKGKHEKSTDYFCVLMEKNVQ